MTEREDEEEGRKSLVKELLTRRLGFEPAPKVVDESMEFVGELLAPLLERLKEQAEIILALRKEREDVTELRERLKEAEAALLELQRQVDEALDQRDESLDLAQESVVKLSEATQRAERAEAEVEASTIRLEQEEADGDTTRMERDAHREKHTALARYCGDLEAQVASLQREKEEAIGKWQGAEACILGRDHTIKVLRAARQEVEERAAKLAILLDTCKPETHDSHLQYGSGPNSECTRCQVEAALSEEQAGAKEGWYKDRCTCGHVHIGDSCYNRCGCTGFVQANPSPAPGAKEESEP